MIGLPTGGEAQALIRGIRHQSTWVYPKLRILEGHFPRSGEVMVGVLAHQKLSISQDQLTIGKELRFNDQSFTVSGIFAANGTVMEAEVWMPLQDLMTATQRDNLSCVVVHMLEVNGFSDVEIFAKTRLDLELVAIRESEYYNSLSTFYRPIRWMSWVCAVLLAVGAILGGLNSLHAAFSSRIREFGALQAIGFSRGALLYSLIQESTIYCLLGSTLAFSIAAFLLQGISFPFSIGVFVLNFDFAVLQVGLFTCFGLGFIGGLTPGWKCLRPTLPQTLRAS
jgi:putative ABC transport system permease protein